MNIFQKTSHYCLITVKMLYIYRIYFTAKSYFIILQEINL